MNLTVTVWLLIIINRSTEILKYVVSIEILEIKLGWHSYILDLYVVHTKIPCNYVTKSVLFFLISSIHQ